MIGLFWLRSQSSMHSITFRCLFVLEFQGWNYLTTPQEKYQRKSSRQINLPIFLDLLVGFAILGLQLCCEQWLCKETKMRCPQTGGWCCYPKIHRLVNSQICFYMFFWYISHFSGQKMKLQQSKKSFFFVSVAACPHVLDATMTQWLVGPNGWLS